MRISFNKYSNVRVSKAGYSFASKGEAALFDLLNLRVKAGELEDLRIQQTVMLTNAKIKYIADFSALCVESGEMQWFEYKGYETPEWRIKRRLWLSYGPGKLFIYKSKSGKVALYETLIPEQ